MSLESKLESKSMSLESGLESLNLQNTGIRSKIGITWCWNRNQNRNHRFWKTVVGAFTLLRLIKLKVFDQRVICIVHNHVFMCMIYVSNTHIHSELPVYLSVFLVMFRSLSTLDDSVKTQSWHLFYLDTECIHMGQQKHQINMDCTAKLNLTV